MMVSHFRVFCLQEWGQEASEKEILGMFQDIKTPNDLRHLVGAVESEGGVQAINAGEFGNIILSAYNSALAPRELTQHHVPEKVTAREGTGR